MNILHKKDWEIKSSFITDENIYKQRRDFIKKAGLFAASLTPLGAITNIANYKKSSTPKDLKLTSYKNITTYNNFYEFGTGKGDPSKNSKNFKSNPWTLKVDGMVKNPITLDYDDILKAFPLQERIYRFRCVEAWSMVIPWIGFPLDSLLNRVQPLGSAKYVAFATLYDKKQFPNQNSLLPALSYPYVEGLRLDEAMNDLSLLSVGLYGKTLPNQNGAPIRLVVPWKYGFKSIKSIVKITLLDREPPTTWNKLAPKEYGFYANVNPQVDHPRWSQKKERVIGSFLRQKTLMFNGYTKEVAHMYKDMNLRAFY